MRRAAIWLLLLLVVLLSVPLAVSARGQAAHPLVGQTLPPVPMRDLGQQSVMLEGGKEPTLVLFWTTWCPTCAQALGQVQALKTRFGTKIHVRLVDVAVSETGRASVREFVQRRDVHGDVYLDTLGEAADRWQVRALPSLYLIAQDGKLVKVVDGKELTAKHVAPLVEQLLGGDGVRSDLSQALRRRSNTKR